MMRRRTRQRSGRRWLSHALTVACCGLLWAGYTAWHHAHQSGDDWGQLVTHDTAVPVHASHAAVQIETRTGCRIRHPGSAPWDRHNAQGSEWRAATRVALLRMGLPPQHADEAVRKISAGALDDVVSMRGDGGLAMHSRQRYSPSFSTTALHDGRRIVCHDSRYVFDSAGRSEGAALYRVGGYHVAVFGSCGNVSRLLPDDAPQAGPQAQAAVYQVPEPGTLWLVLAGLVGLIFTRRFR